jgi:hypothetical protein
MPVSTAINATSNMGDTYELNACDGVVFMGSTDRYSPNFVVKKGGFLLRAFGLDFSHFIEVELVNDKCCPPMTEKVRLPECAEIYKTQPQIEIPYPGTYRLHIKCGDPSTLSIQKTDLDT